MSPTEQQRQKIENSKRIMYVVEKFLPPECPKCKHKFEKEGIDYSKYSGDLVEGRKVFYLTSGYDVIICLCCGNYTIRIPQESFCLLERAAAEDLVRTGGFVNFHEVETFGRAPAVNTHTIGGIVYTTVEGAEMLEKAQKQKKRG